MKNQNAFVYTHRNPKTLEIFYVGIGVRKDRPTSTKNRNIHWQRYVDKHGSPVIEIIHTGLTWDQACEIEVSLIEKHGRMCLGGQLVNMTIGGDGAVGVVYSQETLSIKRAAMNRPEVREKLRKITLKQWESPEFREIVTESRRADMIKRNINGLPGVKEKQRKHARENNSFTRPDVREKIKQSWVKRKADPVWVEKYKQVHINANNPKSKKVVSTKDGIELIHSSFRQAGISTGVERRKIIELVASGKTHKSGYKFRYNQ